MSKDAVKKKPTLDQITFTFGKETLRNTVNVDVPSVLLLVGPNSSGKSMAIKELYAWLVGARSGDPFNIVSRVHCRLPEDFPELLKMFKPVIGREETGKAFIRKGNPNGNFEYRETELARFGSTSNYDFATSENRQYMVEPFTVYLNRENLFKIIESPKNSAPLVGEAKNLFHHLQTDRESLEIVRKYILRAMGKVFVIDPTSVTQLKAAFADAPPPDSLHEFSYGPEALSYFQNTSSVATIGDGYKVYCGAIVAVAGLAFKNVLLDEPDAFLHPPLIRRLARDLTEITKERGGTLVVATHSADFVVGCLETTRDVGIVRLTYSQGESSVRYLPQSEVRKLMNDPLIRTVGPLRGLFHESVVVVEGDTDRSFFEEVTRRLNSIDKGPRDALYLNATNWANVPRLIAPLRRLGIPTAGIVDFDVLADKDNWGDRGYYNALHIPSNLQSQIESERASIADLLLASKVNGNKPYQERGIAAYPGEEDRLTAFIDKLAKYGFFIVPTGTLESFLKPLLKGESVSKSRWLPKIFALMGDDPSSDDYVNATTGDVWDFIEKVGRWTSDPNRDGMPL